MDTVRKNLKKVAEYIQNKLKEDELHDQLTMREDTDPLTGSKQQSPPRSQVAKSASRRCWDQSLTGVFGKAPGYAGGYLLWKKLMCYGNAEKNK